MFSVKLDFSRLMIIELSGISVAYNCFLDVFTARDFFLNKLSSEVNKIKLIKHLLLIACGCNRRNLSERMMNLLSQDKNLILSVSSMLTFCCHCLKPCFVSFFFNPLPSIPISVPQWLYFCS